ncbi:MAG: hypothetical protein P8X46_08510, partial [Nitrospirales bacterium]
MVLQTIQRVFILLIILEGAQITSAESLTPSPSTIKLKEPVHFLAPDGRDVLVQSGPYRVESAAHALQFISEEGRVLLIAAEEAIHEENVNVPVAVSLAGEEDEFKDLHMVILLFPGGQSLEAAGSYSGVRERGILRTKITNFKRSAQRRIIQATTKATTQVQPDHMVRRVTP